MGRDGRSRDVGVIGVVQFSVSEGLKGLPLDLSEQVMMQSPCKRAGYLFCGEKFGGGLIPTGKLFGLF